MAAYAVNFIDRQIISLLVEPLKHDLRINDFEVGELQGVSFGLFYTLLGLPFGWLADRMHRFRLICAGMILWSVATMACGLAHDFQSLLLARMVVGIGEASLVPAAISLLADLFEPGARALPMSLFTAGVSIGSGLALMLGGATVAFASGGAHALPLVGGWLADRAAWQVTFLLVGSAGIPLALLMLTLREPDRRGSRPALAAGDAASVETAGVVAHLRRHRAAFLPFLAGVGFLYILTNADSSWIPSIFIRDYGWRPVDVGAVIGAPIVLAAVLGTMLSGTIATRIGPERAGAMRTMAHGALFFLFPVGLVAPLAPDAAFAAVGAVLVFMSVAFTFGVATAAIVAITPNRQRGRTIAIYLLVGNLFGLGLGPVSVGFCLDHVLHDPHRVGQALALVALCAGLPGALLLRASLPGYAVARAELAGI